MKILETTQGNVDGVNLAQVLLIGAVGLALLLLSCNSAQPVDTDPNKSDPIDSVSPHEPAATGQVLCCRWNHYVIDGGGGQTGLAVNPLSPNVVYATMDHGGIVKSTDHGDTWHTINNNIGRMRLADVKLDPLNPDILYVTAAFCRGCGQGELYRSLDGGTHWEFLTSAFGVEKWPSAREIVIIPQDADGDRISDVIYVGGWAGEAGGDGGGIWKSDDEGNTWKQIGRVDGDNQLLKRANVWVLRNDPANPDVLYAGMYVYRVSDTPGGIFKSTDGGLTWRDITHDIPVPYISDIAISPDGDTLYAATNTFYASERGAGIFKSTDGGNTWTPVNRGLERTSLKFEVLLMDQDDPDVLYAGPFKSPAKGIFKTVDGGEHWYRTDYDHTGWWKAALGNSWAIAEGADAKLYLATWSGIYRSDDHGESWLIRSRGLGNIQVFDIALDPQNPSTVYVALADRGPWKSTDGGHTWFQIDDGYFKPYDRSSGSVAALAISPSEPQTIYSTVRGSSGSTLMGVNKTTNGGKSWQAINNGLPGPNPAWIANDVVVHPLESDIAYLGIKTDAGTGAVFKTVNAGKEWTELLQIDPQGHLPGVESLSISASDPDTLVVGTRQPGRIYKTTDGGVNWVLVSPPPELMNPDTIVHDIDIHPNNSDLIVIGTNLYGAYQTIDGGQTWRQILDPDFVEDNVGNLALNPDEPINATIKAVKFDPDDPRIIYAGHDNQQGRAGLGVLKSTDGGASWSIIISSGLQYRNVFVMDIHPQTKELFIGGFDGVYKYEQFYRDQ